MFLHIGENQLIKLKDIIGIFDIDTLKNSEGNNRFFRKIDKEIKDEKSLFIVQAKETKVYLSNISVATLKKRIER